jgi:transposase
VDRAVNALESALRRPERVGYRSVVRAVGDKDTNEATVMLAIGRPNRKLQPVEITALVTAYRTGASITELADRFEVHWQTAKTHLERAGIEGRGRSADLSEASICEAVRLYELGHSMSEAGRRVGVSAGTISRRLRALGVRVRDRSERVR